MKRRASDFRLVYTSENKKRSCGFLGVLVLLVVDVSPLTLPGKHVLLFLCALCGSAVMVYTERPNQRSQRVPGLPKTASALGGCTCEILHSPAQVLGKFKRRDKGLKTLREGKRWPRFLQGFYPSGIT